MAVDLTILVGTMTSTAELVAQAVQLATEEDDVRIDIKPMDGLDAGVFAGGGLYLICTSTYGQGDVPDNAKALYASLQSARPDLSGVEYGVIALGDRTYAETFCFGGKRFDELLTELGARRLGEVFRHDASAGTMPEELAAEWAIGWIENVKAGRERAACLHVFYPADRPLGRQLFRHGAGARVMAEHLAQPARAQFGQKFVEAFAAEAEGFGIGAIAQRDHAVFHAREIGTRALQGRVQGLGIVRHVTLAIRGRADQVQAAAGEHARIKPIHGLDVDARVVFFGRELHRLRHQFGRAGHGADQYGQVHRHSLVQQLPGAVLDAYHHHRASIQPFMIGGRKVEYAVSRRQVLDVFQGFAQGSAELSGPGRGFFQGLGDGALQHQARVPGVRAEGGVAASAVRALISLDVFERWFLALIAVGQLIRDQHRTDRQYRALDVLAAHAQKIVVGTAVGLVNLPLVASLDQRRLRQHRRRARAHHQHRIRIRAEDLQNLTGDAGIGAVVALGRDYLYALGRGDAVHDTQPQFAIAVGVADERHGLHAIGHHVRDNGASHDAEILRRLKYPCGLVRCRSERRQCDLRRLRLRRHFQHRGRCRRGARTDNDIRLVFAGQLARVLGGGGRIGGVIQYHVLNLLPAHRRRHPRYGVLFRYAQRRRWSGSRQGHADGDIRERGCGCAGQKQRQQGTQRFAHENSSSFD